MPDLVPWSAPQSGPVRATVTLPGSKSLTARALLLAAISDGPSTLTGVLRSRDTTLMRKALEVLGAAFEDVPCPTALAAPGAAASVPATAAPVSATVRVTPAPLPLHVRAGQNALPAAAREAGAVAAVDCGLAGTVMRFLPPLLALADAPVLLHGDDAAARRPLAGLLEALAAPACRGGLGASLTFLGEPGFLPVVISPDPRWARAAGPVQAGSAPAEVEVDSSASSQFLSALLLAGCLLPGGARVAAVGDVPSLPHVAMTATSLRARGVAVSEPEQAGGAVVPAMDGRDASPAPRTWTVAAGRPQAGSWQIEPDLSNAGPFLAAALVTGGTVSVPGWPARTTQAGDAWRWLLPALGGKVTTTEHEDGTLTVTATGTGRLRGIDADLSAVGELTPTVAALATLASAQGQASRLRGISHLRGHETDRLAALVSEITRLGGRARQTTDGIEVAPLPAGRVLQGTCLRTYADHRMATFAALIGLAVPGVSLEDVSCTSKTLPDFPALWASTVSPVAGGGTHTDHPTEGRC